MRFSLLYLVLYVIFTACGDSGAQPDASPKVDAALDAPDLAVCDYSEQRDATNDTVSDLAAQAEDTGKAVGAAGAAALTVCGQLDATHFVAPELVDIDSYQFRVDSETDVRIDIAADVRIDIAGAGLESLRDVTVDLYVGPDFVDQVGTTAKFLGNHAVYDAHVVAGTYELVIEGGNAAAIGAPVPYSAKIAVDNPTTRCATATGAAAYNEALDTAPQHSGNNVVEIKNPTEKLTAATNDMPEPTALTIAPQMTYRITGSLADIPTTSSYKDIDTFQIKTGATTNEIAVRVNWPGTTQDIDLFVFSEGIVPRIGRAITAAKHEDEFKTFAVKPNSAYWLSVGNDKGGGGGSYALTVCGAALAP